MKLRNLFAVAMASAVLFSCTEKNDVKTPGEETGITRIKVGITADALTRAAVDHYDENPTVDELKIYNYALFIFNASEMLEASLIARPYTVDGAGSPAINYPSTGLTFSKEDNSNLDDDDVLTLTAGTKIFFAIVNAPAELLRTQNQYLSDNSLNRQTLTSEKLSFSDLSKIVGAYDSDSYGGVVYFENEVDGTNLASNNRGFMMTTIGTTGYEERVLTEKEEGEYEEVTLSVGRAMAKVSLASDLPTNVDAEKTPNGTLNVLSYKIINNPNEMYIMPHIGINTVWTTPAYYEQTVNPANYFASHNSVKAYAGTFDTNYMPASTNGAKTFTYCIENGNLTPKQGNATIAVVKGIFTPISTSSNSVFVTDYPGSSNAETLTEGDTFYRIWIPEHINTLSGEAAGNRYVAGYYYTNNPTHIDNNAGNGKSYLEEYFDAQKTVQGWPDDLELEIEEFTNGECYYRLPLYNENNTMAPYTVKRNSYYMINIVSVSDNGYTDEDGGGKVDPETPLEPQTNIKVTINVDEWDTIEQPGKL